MAEGDADPNADGYRSDPDGEPTANADSTSPVGVEGDCNANTIQDNAILDRKRSASSPVVHLAPLREGRVVLPTRYQRQLNAHRARQAAESREPGTVAAPSQNNDAESDDLQTMDTSDTATSADSPIEGVSNDWSDRLDDLDAALKWIRQELIQIKEDDRFLMRRLLDLTASIHLIQRRPSQLSMSANLALLGSCGSNLDVATWSSFLSLDEQALIERNNISGSDSRLMLPEIMAYVQDRKFGACPPSAGTLARGLRGYGDGLGDVISRSVSTREAVRPPFRIKRKNSLPIAAEEDSD